MEKSNIEKNNQSDALEKTERINLLFDFFGDLLTDRQRYFMHARYQEDLSLSEIANAEGITRQAVRDILLRSCATLETYETATGACDRFLKQQTAVKKLEECLIKVNDLNKSHWKNKELLDLCNEMYSSLLPLKGEEH